STFGRKPLRSVTGARAGWSDAESTATTWSPAPTANTDSVKDADNTTIRSGLSSIVTSPFAPVTVTGNAPAPASGPLVTGATTLDPATEPDTLGVEDGAPTGRPAESSPQATSAMTHAIPAITPRRATPILITPSLP